MSKIIDTKRRYKEAREEFEKRSKSKKDNLWTRFARKQPGVDPGGPKRRRIGDVATSSVVETVKSTGSLGEGESELVAENRQISEAESSAEVKTDSSESTGLQMSEDQIEAALLARLTM